MTQYFDSPGKLADAVVSAIGNEIVLGLPVGIGKAVHFANALYERAERDPSISLTIFTALTLHPPEPRSDLERRFLEPLAKRLWGGWPRLHFADAVRRQSLPANIRVREFYFRPGSYLGNATAQQSYTSLNYTQVAGELLKLGVNVIGQLVAPPAGGGESYSLGSNPEVTLDLLPAIDARRAAGEPVAFVGEVNERMPYLFGDAELEASRFDFVLASGDGHYPLFGLPRRAVSDRDFATAMHVASLVPDGGTLQLGIGSLSEALAHCLVLRHREPDVFREVLQRLPGGPASGRRPDLPLETAPFREGLYASTELLSDAVYALFAAGLITRGADDPDGTLLHAGFFLGSSSFYAALKALPEERRRRIAMSSISFVNSLYGDEKAKRRQRRNGRFVNEIMMVTLLGAAVSDGLEDGRVVSGVGGQFDFVRMAHALEDGQSILMFGSRRIHEGMAKSNIVWNYGHTTVPRHYRDVYACEYGLADTRGQPDEAVIASLLNIADSAFQAELLARAKAARKIGRDFTIPASASGNAPAALRSAFRAYSEHFPPYPLGSDLTPVERELAAALGWLKNHTSGSWPKLRTAAAALVHKPGPATEGALARLDLERPASLREWFTRRLVSHALDRSRHE
ncbi:MAG TPA: acetyl-CoA hydrolase/transferase C-terminal domain-containing protein [Woeseiaceae bacterium]|nr:acetyl-CoA hydrolase/transferase C-terminal domain-containing protein [Woeseiaceae bacterium]